MTTLPSCHLVLDKEKSTWWRQVTETEILRSLLSDTQQRWSLCLRASLALGKEGFSGSPQQPLCWEPQTGIRQREHQLAPLWVPLPSVRTTSFVKEVLQVPRKFYDIMWRPTRFLHSAWQLLRNIFKFLSEPLNTISLISRQVLWFSDFVCVLYNFKTNGSQVRGLVSWAWCSKILVSFWNRP
jgi:hypothetical protein